VIFVVSREQEGHAERAESSVLRVSLLVVAHVLDQVFDGDGLLVLVGVSAGAEASLVDEDVGVGGQAGDGAGRVGAEFVGLFRCLLELLFVLLVVIIRVRGDRERRE